MATGLFAASTPETGTDQHLHAAMDAGDAEMQPLSNDAACTECDYPLDATEPGQATQPTC